MAKATSRLRSLGALLLAAAIVVCGNPAMAEEVKIAEVNGVWAQDSTSDVGKIFKVKQLEGFKVRGWLSTYYEGRTGNASNQTLINGRVYDIHDRSFAVELVKFEMEKVPTEDSRAGFKLDLAWGDTQDQIAARVAAAAGAGSDCGPAGNGTCKNLQTATVGYLVPLGSGLRFDMGKMTSHIGAEYADGIKNLNFSHDYLYTFAIPYNQTGIRLNYKLSDHFTGEVYALNGWDTHFDNDKGTSLSPSLQYEFGPVAGALSYFAGLETDAGTGGGPVPGARVGTRSTMRHLIDYNMTFISGDWTLMGAYDWGSQNGILSPGSFPGAVAGSDGSRTVTWYGGAVYVAYRINEQHRPAIRGEIYVDPDNYTTNQTIQTTTQLAGTGVTPAVGGVNSIATRFNSLTFTWNYKPGPHFLIRPEFRWDKSNRRSSLFIDNHGRPVSSIGTAAINANFFF